MTRTVRVGMLGCGIVGSATAQILRDHADELSRRAGARIQLVKVAVRDTTKARQVELDPEVWTSDPHDVVGHPSIDIVVEVMGGIEPARELLLQAVRSGKHVVTANKELLSTVGQDVLEPARDAGVDVLFEGAVAGGIPIIRPMKESLAGDRVRRVMGIVNGTTNFILTRMSETGETFAQALAQAEALGYTELDPSADIEGFDPAAKIAILASIAFDAHVVASDVQREGIARVTPEDVSAAHDLGYEIKLVAVAESEGGMISARVHPAMIPKTHPLASVRDVFNAVFVEGEHVGELMFFGRGAGGGPTASAVVGDIVELARDLVGGRRASAPPLGQRARMRPENETRVRYYIVLSVLDQPGVLASVASVFARNRVSIASVRQEGLGDQATLVVITHSASEGAHRTTVEELGELEVVKSIDSKMRVIGTEEG